jgi:KAP family P-loop domain protein
MIYDGWLKIQDWLHERSLIYDKYSKGIPEKSDAVKIDFQNLQYGWLEMVFHINGKRQLMIPLSDLYNPLKDIVQWLEAIIDLGNNNSYYEQTLHIDSEGSHVLMHYELIELPEFGGIEDQRGLFIVYCSDRDDNENTVTAICSPIDLVRNIYIPLINFWGFGNHGQYDDNYITENWSMSNEEAVTSLDFFNELKSTKLEWFISPKKYDEWFNKQFVTPRIKKIILISPKEEGIFWDTNGNCLNNGTELVIEGKAYNLTTIHEFDDWIRPLHSGGLHHPSNVTLKFLSKIREILADEIEIFYDSTTGNGQIMNYELVPNPRLWQEGNWSGLRYQRIK